MLAEPVTQLALLFVTAQQHGHHIHPHPLIHALTHTHEKHKRKHTVAQRFVTTLAESFSSLRYAKVTAPPKKNSSGSGSSGIRRQRRGCSSCVTTRNALRRRRCDRSNEVRAEASLSRDVVSLANVDEKSLPYTDGSVVCVLEVLQRLVYGFTLN